jgi:hypothetical protein
MLKMPILKISRRSTLKISLAGLVKVASDRHALASSPEEEFKQAFEKPDPSSRP